MFNQTNLSLCNQWTHGALNNPHSKSLFSTPPLFSSRKITNLNCLPKGKCHSLHHLTCQITETTLRKISNPYFCMSYPGMKPVNDVKKECSSKDIHNPMPITSGPDINRIENWGNKVGVCQCWRSIIVNDYCVRGR